MKKLQKVLKNKNKIIFLDLEGTETSQEIIAIGAIKGSLDNKLNVKENYKKFKVFVIPKNPVGKIIESLTNINDDFLKINGVYFKNALEKFSNFVGANPEEYLYVTYGNYDIRLLRNTVLLNKIKNSEVLDAFYKNYFDFSSFLHQFIRRNNGQYISLKDALKVFNSTFIGEEHDPLSDAINLSRLFNLFKNQKNILLTEYKKTIEHHSNLPTAINKAISLLNENKSISYDEYLKLFEDELK